jgi:hypothetical protein
MPFPDENDDWAELARELARDKPQPPPAEEPTSSEEVGVFGEGAAEVTAASDELDDVPDGAGETGTETGPDGQPGTGRKRRRRRRRRRRGGADQPAGAGADVEAIEGEESLEASESEFAEADSDASEVGYGDEGEIEPDLEPLAADVDSDDDDAGEELLRDLIANWNVPSWDDVVGGLYRPER